MVFWSHSLGGETKWGISTICSNVAYKLNIQTKNLYCDRQVFICFTFCHQRTRWQTRDKYCIRHGRTKMDCSFVVSGAWYVSPSQISMDERRQRRKTHEVHKSANKRCPKCTELWQLIKAHAPNVAAINYAEGSIVCFAFFFFRSWKDLKTRWAVGAAGVLFFLPSLPPLLPWCHGCVWDLEHI